MSELGDTGGKLSDLGGWGAVEPRHQRTMQRGWDRHIRVRAQEIAIDRL
jgi:hypothetical protein